MLYAYIIVIENLILQLFTTKICIYVHLLSEGMAVNLGDSTPQELLRLLESK